MKFFGAVLLFAVLAQMCGLGEYGRHPNALLVPGPGHTRKAVRRPATKTTLSGERR